MVKHGIQEQVMIAGDDDLVPMRLRAEPVDGELELLKGTRLGEVAGVDEQLPIRKLKLGVMRVGDTDDLDWIDDGLGRRRRPGGCVQLSGEEDDR